MTPFFCDVRSSAAAAASKYPSFAQRAPCSNRQTGQRVSVREIRYRKQPPTVRKEYSVPEIASSGTRRIFRGIRCKKQAPTVRKEYSVPETPSYGTGRVFKGAKQPTPQTVDSLLLHRTHFQRRETADSDTRPLNYPVRPYPSAPPHLKYGLNY